MTENIDAETIKKTQDTLGKFVKKPPLTEKLLRKPPFKFILDVVKAVIRDTNFLENLYTDDELNAEKDRDGKIKFLQKLIDVVKIVTQQDLQVKTSKIVAGLEADKTNELFQAIAYALENKLDSKEAVAAVKNGAVIQMKTKVSTKNDAKSKPTVQKSTNKSKEPPSRDRTPAKPEQKKQVASQRSVEKRTPSTVRGEKEKAAATKEKLATKSRTINDKNETKKLKKVPSKDIEAVGKNEGDKIMTNGSVDSIKESSVTPPRQNSQEKENQKEEVNQLIENNEPTEVEEKKEPEEPKLNGDVNHHENHLVNNSHILEVDKEPQENNSKPQDELAAIIDEEAEFRRREKSTKKLSSRHRQKSVENESQEKQPEQPQPLQEANQQKPQPQAEKIERFQSSYKRESLERPRTSLRPPSARPASSRPAAPRRRDKNIEIVLQPEENIQLGNIQVKMENFSKELEDDGENLVIIEDPSASSDATNFLNERLSKNASVDSGEAVQNDHGHLVQQILETEKNFEGALGMDGGEVKKTEIEFDETRNQSNLKQIENLKDLIQKLVRSLNPMGKLMDYVQEDIDSMQREYAKWNEIYKQAAMDLKREQSETQAAVEPLRFQLNQLEKSIAEHHELIDQLRGNLMMSENKINKIFTDV